MTKLRVILAWVLYFAIVGILLILGFKFSGFLGWIELILLGFLCHAGVDYALRKKFKKKKEKNTNV
jgi:hypothetical protein